MLLKWALLGSLLTAKCSALQNGTTTTSAGWVPNPDRRGTANILESCLFTIFVCTWTVQHLNLPSTSDSAMTIFLRKFKWMMITMLAPEWAFASALQSRANAGDMTKEVWKVREEKVSEEERGKRSWTLTHSFYANMGGFLLKIKDREPVSNRRRTLRDVFRESDSFPINAAQMCELIKSGLLKDVPLISRQEIEDKSKGDIFAKGIAFFQVLWMIIQCSARRAQSLPLSPLEISTLAFAVCTIGAYLALWSKPLDVRVPTTVGIDSLPDNLLRPLKDSHGFSVFLNILYRDGDIRMLQFDRVPNDSSLLKGGWRSAIDIFGLIIGSSVFGGIHCAAWNFKFPPGGFEQTLWRAASSIMAGIIPGFLVIYSVVILIVLYFGPSLLDDTLTPTMHCITIIYILARLCILVETFASLRHLPVEAYHVVTWARYIPNFH